MRPLWWIALVLSAAPPRETSTRPVAEPSADLLPAVHLAEEAVRAAACEAERRFGEGDPDANAARCDDARPVAGVAVGRTSARLRNPANAAPGWARGFVERSDGRRASEVPPAIFDLGDRVGLLRAIEVKRRCLSCHAARERIAPATRAWLARAYPEDRSFDYKLGDLRGFWWAEAPKAPGGAR